jgi:hypothetical protein
VFFKINTGEYRLERFDREAFVVFVVAADCYDESL